MKKNTAFNRCRLGSILCCFIGLLFGPIQAQEQIRVHTYGSSVSRDKTPMEGLEEALLDAKRNAFLKAGVSEHLIVSNLIHTYGSTQSSETYFHGISNTEIGANILVDSIYNQQNEFDPHGNMRVSLEIDALIYTYKKPKDSGFFFEISHLKDVYYENEFINFSFTPSSDGYLTVFVFNTDESYVLYPYENVIYDYLSDEKEQLFIKEEQVFFPVNKAYDPGYSVEVTDSSKDEASLILFVFTKKHIPWIQEQVSLESVRSWVYEIPIDQRNVLYRNVLLKQLD